MVKVITHGCEMTNLQHQGYEYHQYSIYYGSRRLGKKCLQYFHIYEHELLNFSITRPYKSIHAIYFV